MKCYSTFIQCSHVKQKEAGMGYNTHEKGASIHAPLYMTCDL